MRAWLEAKATAWLDYHHGHGETYQVRYFRCRGCGGLVTWKQIRRGGCACGRGSELRPAHLTRREMFRCLVLPWTVGRKLYPVEQTAPATGAKWAPNA